MLLSTTSLTDSSQRTEAESLTRCVASCDILKDGRYQSCNGCDAVVVCRNGMKHETGCTDEYIWDDVHKACMSSSTTCGEWQH